MSNSTLRISREKSGYRLQQEQTLPAERSEVFEFFGDPANLEAITPGRLSFSIESVDPEPVEEGTVLEYELTLWWVAPIRWTSEIVTWEPPNRFIDRMIRGPYRHWHHEHQFEDAPDGTRVIDEIRYNLPLEPISRPLHPLIIKPDLHSIFSTRARRLSEIFESDG